MKHEHEPFEHYFWEDSVGYTVLTGVALMIALGFIVFAVATIIIDVLPLLNYE